MARGLQRASPPESRTAPLVSSTGGDADEFVAVRRIQAVIQRGMDLFIGGKRRDSLPYLCADHRAHKLGRLIGNAGPEEDLVGAVTLLGGDRFPQVRFGLRRISRSPKNSFPGQVPEGRMVLAHADVAVGVYDGIEHTRTAGNHLRLCGRRPGFCPLQHGLDNGPVTPFFPGSPQPPDTYS